MKRFTHQLITSICLLILIALTSATAQQTNTNSKDKTFGQLRTMFADTVSDTQPWGNYPRPQMQRNIWLNLNAQWNYAITPKDTPQPKKWDGKILVPFPIESQLSGVQRNVGPNNHLWYQRQFNLRELEPEERILLHFGAVDWQTTVWINGTQVGQHRGGYTPFSFDITDALNQNKNTNHEIVIRVYDPTDAGHQPRGKQKTNPAGIYYTPVTGIWQTVWLEVVNELSIQHLKITPDIDKKELRVTATLRGDINNEQTIRISGMLEYFGHEGIPASTIVKNQTVELIFNVENPILWTPTNPNLYDLNFELAIGDKLIDKVESYAAMRKISIRKDRFGIPRLALNNEIMFQLGPLDQGWWPDGLYTAPNDQALMQDVHRTKALGFNATRKHVKIEPARWYYWCDQLGLLVWQDMPSARAAKNNNVGEPINKPNPEHAQQFKHELKSMIDFLHNHPSVIVWVPFNEGWGQHNTDQLIQWIKNYDPSRLVDGPSGWTDTGTGDMIDIHRYPGPSMHLPTKERPSVLSEFGGLARIIEGNLWKEDHNWGYAQPKNLDDFKKEYETMMKKLEICIANGLAAAFYTQLTDVETEVNGLMTYDRRNYKAAAGWFYQQHAKLYHVEGGNTPVVILPTSEQSPQTWWYRTDDPPAGWFRGSVINKESWKQAQAPFGAKNFAQLKVNTQWTTPTLYAKQTFKLTRADIAQISNLHIRLHHNDDLTVYLNGVKIHQATGWSPLYRITPLDDKAKQALHVGENTIAIKCTNKKHKHFFDLGLLDMRSPKAIKGRPLEVKHNNPSPIIPVTYQDN